LLELSSQYYTGSTTGTDLWTVGSSLSAGTNGASTLAFGHSGSSGLTQVQVPGLEVGSGTGANGSSAAPAIAFGSSGYGFWYNGAGVGTWSGPSTNYTSLVQGTVRLVAGGRFAWAASTDSTAASDTGLSRLAAASVAVGNGGAGNTAGTLALSRLNGYSADMSGSVSSAPTGVVATNVVVAVGAATATFTVSSTEGFTTGDTVTLSASGWSGGSGLASSTATVTTVTSTTSMILTRASGGPWIAGTYTAQTGTLTETGGTTVSVIYTTAYTSTPIVVVTPTSNAGAFYISASSTTGFTVTYASSGTQTFNYNVIGNPT
jgi:hypothetical protein